MPVLIVIILVILIVIWWGRSNSRLSYNEKLYLKRRGYLDEEILGSPNSGSESSRLISALDSLSDISPGARLRAAQDLAKLCDEGKRDSAMLSSLLVALDDEDSAVRRAVADALGKLNDRRAIEPLKRRLEGDDSIHFQMIAKRALEKLENRLED